MNERDFYYSESDSVSGAPTPEVAPETVATENAAPVAESSMATTDQTSNAPVAAPEQQPVSVEEHTAVAPSSAEEVASAVEMPAEPPAPAVAEAPAAEQSSAPTTEGTDAPAVSDATSAPAADSPQEQPAAPKAPPVIITDEILARLQQAKDSNEIIEVVVAERVRGGLRVMFDNVRLFLPASQFYIKKTPSDDELQAVVGQTIPVNVYEIHKDDTGKISIIASRKNVLKTEFLKSINIGDVVEGTVASVMPFGLFVDLGGCDGLVHVSRISHNRVEDPTAIFKRGDKVKAKITEIDAAKDKIALSMKELEDSPWKSVETDFPVGSRHKGIVRRIVDFGAYVEVKKGMDGLLRVSELSWTKRVQHPSEYVQVGQEVDVEVVYTSAEKRQIGLSLRRLSENPWNTIAEKFPLGAETTGVVNQVIAQGVIVTVGGEFDGFMPRSKMRDVMRGNRVPYKQGDMLSVIIADANPAEGTLILAPKVEQGEQMFGGSREGGRERRHRDGDDRGDRAPRGPRVPKEAEANTNSSFSIMDLLSDSEKNSLFNQSSGE